MTDDLQMMKDILETTKPILLLGSGFSIGAKNAQGNLPDGKTLAMKILNEFYSGKDLEELKGKELRKICTNVVADEKKDELQHYLTNLFINAEPGEGHLKFTNYSWSKIYTLNIDDLVENIYKVQNKGLLVQNSEYVENKDNLPVLIKLHGDVNHPEIPYIFCDNTYRQNSLSPNCSLESFSNDFFNNDTIFVGTEFDESDILTDLLRNENAGYKDYRYHFFVAPEIKDRILRKKIENNQNYIHIKLTAEKFIEIASEITNKQSMLSEYEIKLKYANLIKIDDALKTHNHDSKIYSGATTTYDDVRNDYDINYYEYRSILDTVLNNKSSSVICVFGKPYIGKSTLARRIIYELSIKGYFSIELKINTVYDFETLKAYLGLIKNNKIAVLCEEAAMYYSNIKTLIEGYNFSSKKIIVVTTSNKTIHLSKCHEINVFYNYYPLELKEEINNVKAKLIFNKLEEKSRLGTLSEIRPFTRNKCINVLSSKGDLINCLYYVSHGEDYELYFDKEYNKFIVDTSVNNFLFDIILFSIMGIESFPASYIRLYYGNISEGLIQSMETILSVYENGDVKIRAGDYFKRYIIEQDNKFKIKIIKKYALLLKDSVNEKILNTATRIFECLLHFNSLKNSLKVKMSNNDLDVLFDELEKYYKNISYFWLERALLKADKKDFDNAYMYLSQARAIRPNSYKINHAYAQNYLDRGLDLLSADKNNSKAISLYEEGEMLMVNLIEDDKFSENKTHSVHTYIDRRIKYFEIMHKCFTQEEYDKMCNLILQTLAKNPEDEYLIRLKNELKQYALNNGLFIRM